VDSVILDRDLPPRVQFSNTHIAKQMSTSLRLSKHLPITRLSPMSQFMLTKGSLSEWEAAVKNRPDVVTDDMPAGWRIVEKKEEPTSAADPKSRKTGIFSFWGRKESSSVSTTPLVPDRNDAPILQPLDNRSSTPTPLVTAAAISVARPRSQSPRESIKSLSSIPKRERPPSPPSITPSVATTITTTTSLVSDSTSGSLDILPSQPTTSAVSRFLNRFSRSKINPIPSNAIALSSEDIDFLSGSPPNVADDLDEDDLPLAQRKSAIHNAGEGLLPIFPSAAIVPNGSGNRPPPNSSTNDNELASFADAFSLLDAPRDSSVSLVSTKPFLAAGVPSASRSNSTARASTPSATPQSVTADKNPPLSFVFQPPPSSRSRTPPQFPAVRMSSSTVQKTSLPMAIPPPPSSSYSVPSALPQPTPLSYTGNPQANKLEDEFSDFFSPDRDKFINPSYSNANTTTESQLLSTTMDGYPLVSPTESSRFRDYEEFISSPVELVNSPPQPPVPPSKPKYSKSQTSMSTSKSQRVSDHSRTMSLLETAAALKGQWPSPPSSVPITLSPPPLPAVRSNTSMAALLDTVDERPSPMKASSSNQSVISPVGFSDNVAGLTFFGFGAKDNQQLSSLQKKPFEQPMPHSPTLMEFGDFDSLMPVAQIQNPTVGKVDRKPASGGGGGLSAQDLSFFEGL
jgi:hypothetical protein